MEPKETIAQPQAEQETAPSEREQGNIETKVSAEQAIDAAIEKLQASFVMPHDQKDVSDIVDSVHIENKNDEKQIILNANIPRFGSQLKGVYEKVISRLKAMKDDIGRGARTVGLSAAVTLSSLQGSAQQADLTQQEAQIKKEGIENAEGPTFMKNSIEAMRVERMAALQKEIAEEKELLRVHDDKKLFEESFKKKIINHTNEYLKTLPRSNEKVKAVIDGLTEDEVELLMTSIKRDAIASERIEKEMKDGMARNEGEERIDENIYAFVQKHPRVVKASESLKPWLKFDDDRFIESLGKINPLDTTEKAKKSSEIFKEAIDMVEQNHVSFAKQWDADAITQDKIDTEWVNRPSAELLKLDIQKKEQELASIDANLNEKDLLKIIDSSRTEVIAYLSSPEYLHKLIAAEGMTEENAKAMQAKRVSAVQTVSSGLDPTYMGTSRVEKNDSGGVDLTYSAYDLAERPRANGPHELLHVAMDGDANMTADERKIFESGRISEQEFNKVKITPLGETNDMNAGSPFDSHPSDRIMSAAELVPRKYILEKEMERAGIKKAFEPMTHEHYLKARELMQEGKLDQNAVQIILSTTEDGLLNIMNKIAFEESKQKSGVPEISEERNTSIAV